MPKEGRPAFFLAPTELISIAEAAKLTPYSAEYLSLLARQGRLPAIKIARNWLTTRKAVLWYLEKQRQKHQNIALQFEQMQKGVAYES